MGKNKFRKDFTAEQYLAYLEGKAKNPDAIKSEDNEPRDYKI